MKRSFKFTIVIALALSGESSWATEFQKLGKAIGTVLGSTKATKRTISVSGQKVDVFTLKNGASASRYAFVQKGVYAPNCTHTWVVGTDAKTHKVVDIQVIEMSCPHAFPTREKSFLSQFTGKGPADVQKLSGSVVAVAKATGSSDLTTDAVKRSIQGSQQLKGM